MSGWVLVADPTDDVFDSLRENRMILRDAEVRELALIAQACDESSVNEAGAGMAAERLIDGGAPGTACIGEFLSLELGGLLGIAPADAAILIGDVLNLRDRHPELWAHTQAGRLTPRQAVTVARRCAAAGLSADSARWVDHQLGLGLAALPWARVARSLSGLIVKADAALAAERARQRRTERHAYIGDHADGASILGARLDTEDALALDQTISEVANALAAAGSEEPIDQRRATALGILADPQAALNLLAGFGDGTPTNRTATLVVHIAADQVYPEDIEDLRGTPDPILTAWKGHGPTSGLPDGTWTPAPNGTMASSPDSPPNHASWVTPDERVWAEPTWSRTPDPGDPPHPEASPAVVIEGGVARIEGIGALDRTTLRRFLGHTRVTVRPVVDLNTIAPVDQYEIPAGMRQHVLARNPVEVFPYSTRPAGSCDLDHTEPYDWTAPAGAGQTRPDNLGPLSRRTHRAKTARLWHLEQWQPGWYTWTSPHGFQYEVSPHGTTALGRPQPPDDYDGEHEDHF